MTKFIWDIDTKKWVEPAALAPAVAPHVWGDLPPYMSPLGTGEIDGRRARREDMARGGAREVDPSERIEGDRKDPALAREEKAYLDQRAAMSAFQMTERSRERLVRGQQ